MTIETRHGRGYVYCLHYHIVWCVKYRHKVLTPEIVEDLVQILEKIANDNDFEILELNTDTDHVHILIDCSPQHFIPDIMKAIKSVSARLLMKKQRLHHWRAQAVQRIVADKAHRDGVRVRRVCAWNTSKLAFDGSGEVERDEHNYSMCTFKTGKRYHCDPSASYNIGARYFIREILKSLPAKARLGMEAKVPQCTKRTTCTLSTLLSLNAELVA